MSGAGLTDRVVVVTGGNAGIGLGLARGVARAGAAVAVWARRLDRSEEAVEELRALGARSLAVSCDVSDAASVVEAMEQTRARLGPVDALFANAGITGRSVPFADLDLDEWRSVTAVNLDGAFLAFQAAARHMIADGRPGALVGVASTSAFYGAPGRPHYAASKTAVVSLCRTVAVELARHRIRCNALVPGWTDTDMLDHSRDDERFVEATTKRTPVRRWGRPEDFEAAAAFLADPAHDYHTGDRVVIDGGYTAF